jgi:GTP-binding protein
MKIKSATFVTSAKGLVDCPPWERAEFALIGRSNVGKSSMINLLTGKNALAKVSASPGKTRLLNFFLINESWSLVDLPGYGFAKAAKSEKFDFNEMAGDYIEGRPNLRRVFVLIDSRHPPQRIDLDFTHWLIGVNRPFSLIFTKADKQSAAKTRANIELFREALGQLQTAPSPPPVHISSAKSGDGRDAILNSIPQDLV